MVKTGCAEWWTALLHVRSQGGHHTRNTSEGSVPMSALDGAAFRAVLGHYPTGVALVTAISPEGRPIGMIVGSFTSVSIDRKSVV